MPRDHGDIIRAWFSQMAPEYVVWAATPQQLESDESLAAVLDQPGPGTSWPDYPPATPPLVIFSGMTGLEIQLIVQHWKRHTGEWGAWVLCTLLCVRAPRPSRVQAAPATRLAVRAGTQSLMLACSGPPPVQGWRSRPLRRRAWATWAGH